MCVSHFSSEPVQNNYQYVYLFLLRCGETQNNTLTHDFTQPSKQPVCSLSLSAASFTSSVLSGFCCYLKSAVMSWLHCHLFICFGSGGHWAIDQDLQLCQQLCLRLIQALRRSSQSHECSLALVILIKYATSDRHRVTAHAFQCVVVSAG